MLSCYPPESPHRVFHADQWWSDSWDGLHYGRDFDFSRPFFDQFLDLYREVPVINLYQTPNENCDYINGASNCKNCYLCFIMDYCEDCYYVSNGTRCRSCQDCFAVADCELCYECVDCIGCYNVDYSQRCTNCSDSSMLSDCRACRFCIGCSNLVNAEYQIFNQPVSGDEFKAVRERLRSAQNVEAYLAQANELTLGLPKKNYFGHSNEHSIGDSIYHTRNCYACYDSSNLENCRYCNYVFSSHDCQDVDYFGDRSEWLYECLATGLSTAHNLFCMLCWSGSHTNLYCHLVSGCSNCFGCSALRHKEYCILNKQYSKSDYEVLAGRIIEHMQRTGEWGEFFPSRLSPFAFNLSQAQDQLPITRDDVEARGLRWHDIGEARPYSGERLLPHSIDPVTDEILQQALSCGGCGKSYKIIGQELRFYRTKKLPPPTSCPECRHQSRAGRRNRQVLHAQQCVKCAKPLESTWPPSTVKVYCERCYLEEMM